jgi:predicted naringenin-chalcone synthase
MGNFFISDFSRIAPSYCMKQEDILSWITKMHTLAEAKENNLSDENKEGFSKQLFFTLKKVGLGKDKIQQRGIHLEDLIKQTPSDMQIYDLETSSRGLGLTSKMNLFSIETGKIFETFYKICPLPEHLIHVTCTGYVSPSPAQKIVSIKKSSTTTVTHAYHMGCYGALPALRIAKNSSSCDIVHTEFCSLHMNPTNHSLGQLVVESLFADGFIKYSVSSDLDGKCKGFYAIALLELIIPDSSDSMTWRCEDWGFAMFLSQDVPQKIASSLISYLQAIANKANLTLSFLLETAIFAIHPGGPKIILQVQEILKLSSFQVSHSKEVLKDFGNMSSATLPHIWQKILEDTEVSQDSYVVSMAFGPGLTISGAIFRKKG